MTKRSETQPVGHALDKKAEVIPSSTTDAMPETTSHHIHIVAGVVIALPQGPPMPEASSLAPKPTPTPVAGQKEEEKEGKEKEREEEKEGAEESDSVSEPGEETSDDEEEKEEEKKETETPEKPEEAKQPGQLEKPADAGYSERPESLPRPIGPWGPGGPGGPGRNEEADAGIGLGLIDPSGRLPPPKAEIASQTTTSPPAPTATGDDVCFTSIPGTLSPLLLYFVIVNADLDTLISPILIASLRAAAGLLVPARQTHHNLRSVLLGLPSLPPPPPPLPPRPLPDLSSQTLHPPVEASPLVCRRRRAHSPRRTRPSLQTRRIWQ